MAHGAMVDSYLRDLLADRFGDDVTVRDSTYVLPLDRGAPPTRRA